MGVEGALVEVFADPFGPEEVQTLGEVAAIEGDGVTERGTDDHCICGLAEALARCRWKSHRSQLMASVSGRYRSPDLKMTSVYGQATGVAQPWSEIAERQPEPFCHEGWIGLGPQRLDGSFGRRPLWSEEIPGQKFLGRRSETLGDLLAVHEDPIRPEDLDLDGPRTVVGGRDLEHPYLGSGLFVLACAGER